MAAAVKQGHGGRRRASTGKVKPKKPRNGAVIVRNCARCKGTHEFGQRCRDKR
jgi:hypothetical protein